MNASISPTENNDKPNLEVVAEKKDRIQRNLRQINQFQLTTIKNFGEIERLMREIDNDIEDICEGRDI